MDVISLLLSLLYYGAVSAILFLVLLAIVVYIVTKPYPEIERYEEEKYFKDTNNDRMQFPSISEPFQINLSVVVPAYNEEERLPPMLDEALEFLEERVVEHKNYRYEIIVVSDGSKDNTVKVVEKYAQRYGNDKIRCLELIKNRGKGGAVRLGMLSSRGATILFADADGASKFEDLTKLETSLKGLVQYEPVKEPGEVCNVPAVAIGSRAHLEKESLATRSLFRNILMYGFHFLVWLFTVKGIKDTQCGFKLFTRKAADMCFQSLHVNRWAFDVELLLIAQKLNIPISEDPIRWTEIEGSKITPMFTWIQMGCDLGLIWLKYRIGAWKIRSEKAD